MCEGRPVDETKVEKFIIKQTLPFWLHQKFKSGSINEDDPRPWTNFHNFCLGQKWQPGYPGPAQNLLLPRQNSAVVSLAQAKRLPLLGR